MKNKRWVMVGIFLALIQLPTATTANWLEKGLNVINSLDTKETASTKAAEITLPEINKAFKEALRIGADNVVDQLGKVDGFNSDPAIHIPLPEELKAARSILEKVSMGFMADDLELKLNRALEAATPKTKELFWQAITEMTFEDVKNIYDGPKDSATKYFQEKMTPSLYQEMRPIVDKSLSQVGAVAAYDNLVGQYKTMPFVPDLKANLSDHAMNKGLEGLFYYIAKEEEAIRNNPTKQTTELLQKVFGPQR